MKHLLTLIGLLVLLSGYAQNCSETYLTNDEVSELPWIQDSTFIDNFLDTRLGSNPNARSESIDSRYFIPLKLIIYRDNEGNPLSSIAEEDAINIVNLANNILKTAGTGIKLFVRELVTVNNNFYREEINQLGEVADLFTRDKSKGVVKVHLVKNTHNLDPGYAINPTAFGPIVEMVNDVFDLNFNQYLETHHDGGGPKDPDHLAHLLVHELGHNFGLLHTHHPGRLQSLAFNEDNATISNGCLQEMVAEMQELET